MKPPFHGASVERRLRIDDALPRELPREPKLAVDPEAHVALAGRRIAQRDLDVVHTRVPAPRRVRDRVAGGVELVRAVLLGIGPFAGGGEAARERHARERAQRHRRVGTRRPRPAVRLVLGRHDALAVVGERHDEVMEVVFELGDDDARRRSVTTRIRRRYASASRSKSGEELSHARVPVSVPLAAPG